MKTNDKTGIAKSARVLSDPIRLNILQLLKEGRKRTYISPVCQTIPTAVCPEDLQMQLDNISSSKLSYHLKLLKEEHFIQECREGKRIYYFLQPQRMQTFMESLQHFL